MLATLLLEPPHPGKIEAIQKSRRAKEANAVRDRRMHPPRTGYVRFVFHWMSQCSVWRRCSASRRVLVSVQVELVAAATECGPCVMTRVHPPGDEKTAAAQ